MYMFDISHKTAILFNFFLFSRCPIQISVFFHISIFFPYSCYRFPYLFRISIFHLYFHNQFQISVFYLEKVSKYSRPHFFHILNAEKIWNLKCRYIFRIFLHFHIFQILSGKVVQILPSVFFPLEKIWRSEVRVQMRLDVTVGVAR